MRYWWVSQNQTFQHEVSGGYLWSPKVNRNGSISHYYECMREVSSGDLVFSFCDKKIMAIGFALGAAYTCPKPTEFGQSGDYWNNIGWRVDVAFQVLKHPVEPRRHMQLLTPLLPKRYAPIRPDGAGNQMYLTEVTRAFGQVLIGLMSNEADAFLANRAVIVMHPEAAIKNASNNDDLLRRWDKAQIEVIQDDKKLDETEKDQVIKSRRGQGLFRNRVAEIEERCRITGVDQPEHLIASHIKPWRMSSNEERLDGENGLLLTPSIDHLFDDGYISFQDNGDLLVSPTSHRPTLIKMGVPKNENHNVGKFSRVQTKYLEFHRDSIFLKARG